MSAYPVVIHPHWCVICHDRPVINRGDACPGCLGHLENQLEPITRWPATPPRPGRWARFLQRLGGQ